jgi:hypothetical protein
MLHILLVLSLLLFRYLFSPKSVPLFVHFYYTNCTSEYRALNRRYHYVLQASCVVFRGSTLIYAVLASCWNPHRGWNSPTPAAGGWIARHPEAHHRRWTGCQRTDLLSEMSTASGASYATGHSSFFHSHLRPTARTSTAPSTAALRPTPSAESSAGTFKCGQVGPFIVGTVLPDEGSTTRLLYPRR